MVIEPNCDMDWEIYLDWLADQGFDDLRNMDLWSLTTGDIGIFSYHYHLLFHGEGDGGETFGIDYYFDYYHYNNQIGNPFGYCNGFGDGDMGWNFYRVGLQWNNHDSFLDNLGCGT